MSRPLRGRAVLAELLPAGPNTWAEAVVSVAFYARGADTPAYADALRVGLGQLLDAITDRLHAAWHSGQLRPGLDPRQEAASLVWLAHGLVGPLLIGFCTPEAAQALLGHNLDQVFI